LLFFVLFSQRPGRTNEIEGSKRSFPAKEVPFGGLNNQKSNIQGLKPPKPNYILYQNANIIYEKTASSLLNVV